MTEGGYENGLKEGLWVSYYANGKIRSEGHYEKGVKEGKWIQYYANGNKKSEGVFVKGVFSGFYVCWQENGFVQWQGYYNDYDGTSKSGTKDGIWCAYDSVTGEVNRIFHYKRGARTRPDEYPPFAVMKSPGDDRSS